METILCVHNTNCTVTQTDVANMISDLNIYSDFVIMQKVIKQVCISVLVIDPSWIYSGHEKDKTQNCTQPKVNR